MLSEHGVVGERGGRGALSSYLMTSYCARGLLTAPIPSHEVLIPLRPHPAPPVCRFLLSREQGRPPPSDRRGGKGMPWERNLQQMLDENGAGMMQKRVRGGTSGDVVILAVIPPIHHEPLLPSPLPLPQPSALPLPPHLPQVNLIRIPL